MRRRSTALTAEEKKGQRKKKKRQLSSTTRALQAQARERTLIRRRTEARIRQLSREIARTEESSSFETDVDVWPEETIDQGIEYDFAR
jgi:hypothetical protein